MSYRDIAKKLAIWARLHDPCWAKLGFRTRKSDTFLVSYPRSGNTWMRFMIANVLEGQGPVVHDDLGKYVPNIHVSIDQVDSINSPRVIKSHDADFSCYPRWIYMVRDGRDALVSFYYYSVMKNRFYGTFSEFMQSRRARIFDRWTWAAHATQALQCLADGQEGIVIRYEDILADPCRELGKALDFIGIDATVAQIEAAVEQSAFERLQGEESQRSKSRNGDNRFFRRGWVGEWKEIFSEGDIELFEKDSGEVLTRFGYK